MTRSHRALVLCLALIGPALSAGIRPAPNYPVRATNAPLAGRWDTLLPPLWEGWKKRFVHSGWVNGNPQGLNAQDQAHGMLLSVWFGDQGMFDSLWRTTEARLWDDSRNIYHESSAEGSPYASESNFDLCGSLLFASALVKADLWQNTSAESRQYATRAKQLLQSLILRFPSTDFPPQVLPYEDASYRKMSDQSAGWFRLFHEATAKESLPSYDWSKLESGTLSLLRSQPNSNRAMLRSASSPTGTAMIEILPDRDPDAREMGKDALRAVWHLAMAIRWNSTIKPSLVSWAREAWKAGHVNPVQPGMYRVDDASLLGWDEGLYEHFMTRALWGSLAAAAQDSSDTTEPAHKAFHTILDSLQTSMVPGVDFLVDGDTSQSAPARLDVEAQTLGLLGILSMTNNTPNVWTDLNNVCCGPTSTLVPRQTPRAIQRVPEGYLVRMERAQATHFLRGTVVASDGKAVRLSAAALSSQVDGLLVRVAPSAAIRWVQLEDDMGNPKARFPLPPSF